MRIANLINCNNKTYQTSNQIHSFILNTKAKTLNFFKNFGEDKSVRKSSRCPLLKIFSGRPLKHFLWTGLKRSEYVFSLFSKCCCAFVVTKRTDSFFVIVLLGVRELEKEMPTNGYTSSKHTCILTQFCRRPGINP